MKKLSSKILPSVILTSLLSLSCTAIAQPSLANVEYNDSSGEVVINGSSFGSGPKVMLFENFEKGNKFANLLASTSSNWHSDVLLREESSGNKAHRAKDPSVTSGKGLAQIIVNFQQRYTEAFIAFSVKTPPGTTFAGASSPKTFPSMSSWKFTWLMLGANGFDSSSDFDICLPTHVGNGNFLLGGNDGNLTWIEKGSNWWEWDNYNHMTSYIRFDPTQPNSRPVNYSWGVVNNLKRLETIDSVDASTFRSSSFGFDRINIPGWWGNGDNSKFDALYDNLYVAVGPNARARVVLTDNPNFAQSKFSITVMAKSWSSSKIVLDSDVVPGDRAYYAHIFNANNQRSASALRVCPKCPKPVPH